MNHLVVGPKGGCGKSLFALVLVEYLRLRSAPILVVETDMMNLDIADTYEPRTGRNLNVLAVDLDTESGWRELVVAAASYRDGHVVINTGARNYRSLVVGSQTGCIAQLAADAQLLAWWLVTAEEETLHHVKWYVVDGRMSFHPSHLVFNHDSRNLARFPFVNEEAANGCLLRGLLWSRNRDASALARAVRSTGGRELWMLTLPKDLWR